VGEREDTSGETIVEILSPHDFYTMEYAVVPDEADTISAKLVEWADGGQIDLIVTNGGTGLGPRDVTPEATAAVLQRNAPGIAEAMRVGGLVHTPLAMLGRGIAGTRGTCLIINLPGNPRAVRESLEAIAGALGHAMETLKRARVEEHPPH
jgi:molybdenum cofactor synthesis domain-containing protein